MTADANALLPTENLILMLFCRVDDCLEERAMDRKHSQAALHPSEVTTLALLFAFKGTGSRAPSTGGSEATGAGLFPGLPCRTGTTRATWRCGRI